MASSSKKRGGVQVLFLFCCAAVCSASTQDKKQSPAPPPTAKSPSGKQESAPKQPSPEEELQQAIDTGGNDRAALVRNLEAFLQKYPEAQQRPRIYRALVEACLQLRDTARATDYAERIVALTPDDMSITLLTIQLLERNGDEAGLRRATHYASRVLEFIDRGTQDKSPKISKEEWQADKNRDLMTILLLRGRLYLRLHQTHKAQDDFEECYSIVPSAAAAEKLGEIAELNKQLQPAIDQYARAFALADGSKGSPDRRDIRRKLGNVWRLAHGNEDGLGEFLLRAYDEVNSASGRPQANRNLGAKEPYDFTVRKIPDGSPLPLAQQKGKILVVNFWATWCGPCRALEPQFERVAAGFQAYQEVLFLAADCDEDETLVPPYVQEMKPRTAVVFADGLDRLLAVNSFPTVVVIDRNGKITYRAEGFGDEGFEQALTTAIRQAVDGVNTAPSTESSNR